MEWDYYAGEGESCYRIGTDRRGFWNGSIFCALPSQKDHKLLYERINGLPIDIGVKQVVAEVQNELIDFAGCQLGDFGGTSPCQRSGGPYSAAAYTDTPTVGSGAASSASGNIPPSQDAPPARLAPNLIALPDAAER